MKHPLPQHRWWSHLSSVVHMIYLMGWKSQTSGVVDLEQHAIQVAEKVIYTLHFNQDF